MKRKLLCFGFIVSCLAMGTAWGLDDPVGVPWGEWRFLEDFDGAGEVVADKASAPGSLMRINAGSTAITQADNTAIVSETGPGDYLRVDARMPIEEMILYDASGRELFRENLKSGELNIVINTEIFPSGLYQLRVKFTDHVQVKRVVIL